MNCLNLILNYLTLLDESGYMIPAGVMAQEEPIPTPTPTAEPTETPTEEAAEDDSTEVDDADEADAEESESEVEIEYDEGVITVEGAEGPVSNVSVTVTSENGTYTGEYTTDENGTVVLDVGEDADEEALSITTTVDGETVEETATVGGEPEMPLSFGQRVSMFVQSLLGDEDREGGIGQALSEFVRSNNPGADRGNAGEAGAEGREKAEKAKQNGKDRAGENAPERPERPERAGGDESAPEPPDNDAEDDDDASDDRQRGNDRAGERPNPRR